MKRDPHSLNLELGDDSGVYLLASHLFENWGFGDGEMLDDHPAFLLACGEANIEPETVDTRSVLADLIHQYLLPALPAPLRTYRLETTGHNPLRAEEDEHWRRASFEGFGVTVSVTQIAALLQEMRPLRRPALPRSTHPRRAGQAFDKRNTPLDFPRELVIDNFAGGGGTSTGLEAAFGRPVDIAINHDPEALAMHALNHPYTHHLCESVWEVNPVEVTKNQPVGLVWLSPDCKHFSKAKGGTPVAKHIRGLAWVALRWAATTKPRIIAIENVEEFLTWGPLILDGEGNYKPDPAKRGKIFQSFVWQLRKHGYKIEWKVMRACDNGAPTIRKRFFLIARRDGLPICWPAPTHGAPDSADVIAGLLQPWRTAASCIDFELESTSIFERKKSLVDNTLRRVAKGLWRHVLTSEKPFIVSSTAANEEGCPVLTPFINEHANSSSQRTMPADEPLRTVCAQVKGGHFSMVAPTLVPMRGTSEAHLNNAHSVDQPLSTISAGGTHHALVAGHMTKFNTGSVGYGLDQPMATITAGGTPKRPSTGITQGLVGAHLVTVGYGERKGQEARTQDVHSPLGTVVAGGVKSALVAAHLVDMGHGESSKTGAKRWSHGIRDIETPLNTITASGGTSALTQAHLIPSTIPAQAVEAAFMEQANGGFYEGDGRSLDQPVSTITSTGSNQRLVTAYCVKYYSSGGQWQGLSEPMHTIPTKGRLGLVQAIKIPRSCLAPKMLKRARKCAALLRKHLPEHFPKAFDVLLLGDYILVDITLRMLKPKELYLAQSFPSTYQISEIPDPKLLFVNGKQVPGDPRLLPRIPLSGEAQVRMCGNSVAPLQAEAVIRSNFMHEDLIYGRLAA